MLLERKGNIDTEIYKKNSMVCDKKQRDWSALSPTQGMPKLLVTQEARQAGCGGTCLKSP